MEQLKVQKPPISIFPCMCSFCREPEHVLLYFGLTVWRCQDKLLLKVYVQCTES